MPSEPLYSFLENNRFSRDRSYTGKQLRELFSRGGIDRDTELWLWDGDDSRLAGTYESLFIRKRRFKERRLGIYGLPGAGKTAFLAACTCWGGKFDDGSTIVFSDTADTASQRLGHAWNRLRRGERIEATQDFSVVDFSLLHDGAAWEIRTLDYDGERLRHYPAETKLDDWFLECDALLLLLDGKALTSGERSVVVGQFRLFLDHQRQASPDGNRIEKPMAVIVGGADRLHGAVESVLAEVRSLAGEFGSCVEAFSVSAFDPERGMPVGVSRPLQWSVREIDRLRVERTPKTLSEYKALRDLWGINTGELGRRVAREIDRLRQENRRRGKRIRLFLGAILFVLAALTAIGTGHFLRHRERVACLATKSSIMNAPHREAVDIALTTYRERFWASAQHVDELEKLAGTKIAELDADRAETVYRTTRYSIQNADTPGKIDAALDSFRKESPGRPDRYVGELENLATLRRRQLRFRFAWEKMKYAAEQAESFGRTKRAYDEFLETITPEEFPGFADRIEEVRAERERLIAEEREGVRFLPATAFYEKIDRIDEQIRAFDTNDPQRKALEEDRGKIAAQWDPEDYRKFYRLVRKTRTAEDLRHAAAQADRYLDQAAKRTALRISSRYGEDVNRWKAWFDGLKNSHRIELVVTSVLVPKKFFQAREQGATVTIVLNVGRVKAEYHVPEEYEGRESADRIRFEPNLRCRIEDAAWDEHKRTSISLTITERKSGWRSWTWPSARAVCETAGSEYPYIDFCPMPDGVFTFSADEDTIITVTTDVSALGMPDLPEPQ